MIIKGSGVTFDIFQVNPCFYRDHYEHLEIQDFIVPENLDKHAGKIVKGYTKLLSSFKGTISVHGPFKGLLLSSMDRHMQALAHRSLSRALLLGGELGCRLMVVHSCFNPKLNFGGYLESWLDHTSWFWDRMLPLFEKHGVIVALENIFDRTPAPIIRLLNRFKSPYFRACLDTGHVNIFSNLPINEWIYSLGDYLVHFHIHDNHGLNDEHLPPGQGNIDFTWLAGYHNNNNGEVTLVNETFGSIKAERIFLNFLKQFYA